MMAAPREGEALAAAQPPASGSSSAAYPRWVMFEQHVEVKVEDSMADAATMAAAFTSTGRRIQVFLRLAEPPAVSFACLQICDGLQSPGYSWATVLAAHGDSVLIRLSIKEEDGDPYTTDHFVYNAGAAAAEPPQSPTLSLLPPYYGNAIESASGSGLVPRELSWNATGILRRGEGGELVVAELEVSAAVPASLDDDDDTPSEPNVAKLGLFRSGVWSYREIESSEAWRLLPLSWNAVVPVGDRRLCWADLSRGVLLLPDVFAAAPTLRYAGLPADVPFCGSSKRNVCVIAGGAALKLVSICPRYHGGGGAGGETPLHAYTIRTWTLRLDGDGDMAWVGDGVTELWAFEAHTGGHPRARPDHPVVGTDEPEVVCFRLLEPGYGDWTAWRVMVDARSKTIRSVLRQGEGWLGMGDHLVPSSVSCFFNSCGGDGALAGRRQKDDDVERAPAAAVVVGERLIVRDDDASDDPTLQPWSAPSEPPCVQASEMFQVFQEIPSYGLGPDEVKAYRILSGDNGRRLRSLLSLPENMRKDWLLMEIKGMFGSGPT